MRAPTLSLVLAMASIGSSELQAAEYERGWIADIMSERGYRLASYHDDDSSWYSTDVENLIPVDGIANDGIFRRRTKLVVSEEAEYGFGIRSFAPLLNNPTANMKFQMGDKKEAFVEDDAFAPCNVSVTINGQPVLKQGYTVQLVKGGYAETMTTPAFLEPGVYDLEVEVSCRWGNYLALGARKAIARHRNHVPEHWAFGYDIVQAEGDPEVEFAVLKSDLEKVFPSGDKRTMMLSLGQTPPEGYASGWIVSTLPDFPNSTSWPNASAIVLGTSEASSVSAEDLGEAQKHRAALQVSGMYTAPEDGKYVFGIAMTLGEVTHPDIHNVKPFVQKIPTMFRLEGVVFPPAPLQHHRGEFVNDKLFGNVSHLMTWEVQLKAGQTYQLSYLFKTANGLCERRRDDCEKFYKSGNSEGGFQPGSDFQMLVLPPSERGIRHMKSTEVLHAVAETN